MKIEFFCPHWGSEHMPFESFAKKVVADDFAGVEMSLPLQQKEREDILAVLEMHKLKLIGQHWETVEADFKKHKSEYELRLRNLASSKPLFINSQTGKDYFTFEQNQKLILLAAQISEESGVLIVHETHRGKFSFAAHVTKHYLTHLPNLKITLDVSHWCNVAESFLEDQEAAINAAISQTYHIHAREVIHKGLRCPIHRTICGKLLWIYM